MKDSLVSIIIVNWNGLRWLPECFSSLYAQEYKNFEIIFVDNASHDESVVWVKKHFPKTRIIINSQNLGFAEANNVGYRESRGEYVLFLNNDTRVTKTFLKELLAKFKDLTIGGAQSKILLMDHPDTHDSVGAYMTPTGFLYHLGFGKKDSPVYDKDIELYTAKGACMIFRSSVLKKIEYNGWVLDPAYFAYFEESDMCHRVWLSGSRIVYAHKSVIYHKMGATSSSMNNAFIQYHSFKNRINSYLKNMEMKWLILYIPIHILLVLCFAVFSLFQKKWQLGMAIFKAIWWNIRTLPRTVCLRTYIQNNIRIISDDTLRPKIFRSPGFDYYRHLISGTLVEYKENPDMIV